MSSDSNDSRLVLNMDGMQDTFVPEDAFTSKRLQLAGRLKDGDSRLGHKKDWVTNSGNIEKRHSCYQREPTAISLDPFSSTSVVAPSSKSQHHSNAKKGNNMNSLGGPYLNLGNYSYFPCGCCGGFFVLCVSIHQMMSVLPFMPV